MAQALAAPTPEALTRQWLADIEAAEKDKDRQRWLTRCKAILKIYKEQQQGSEATAQSRTKQFALLWSNIQTLAPAVYARTPIPVVSRRFKDSDPVGRISSEILERALAFSTEEADFASAMLGCRDEFLLFARGQAWVRYVPHISSVPAAPGTPPPEQSLQVADDPETYDVVDWEEVIADRLHHDDFLHNPARSWEEVRWTARRAFLTRPELVKRFGDKIGKVVPLDWSPEDKSKNDADESLKKAAVYEVWDKTTKTVLWLSNAYTASPLDQRPDPLKLKNFFPCPKPLFGTLAPDSLVPIPDYMYWQDQASEINVLTARIDGLISALKVRGFYSGALKDNLNALLSSNDNTLLPVDSWAALGDKGGLKGLVDWFPLDQIAAALKQCIATRTQIINDVYQITGISDIQRGDTDPNETATAQSIKANWGSSRVRERQKEIARFSRDLMRIMGEIIATKFGADVLGKMTGVQLMTAAQKQQVQQVMAASQQAAQQAQATGQPAPPPPPIPDEVMAMMQQPSWEDVLGVLRDPALRAFHIDIETDSTVEPNDQEEKQRRIEFVSAIGKYLAEALPVVQASPAILPVIAQGLLYLVRGFRAGREMEDVIDRAVDEMTQAAQQPQQPPQPDPVDQAKAQAATTMAQAKVMEAQTGQQANQVEMAKVQSHHQVAMAGVQAENARTQADYQLGVHQTAAEGAQAIHEAILKAQQRRLVGEINSPHPIEARTP